LRDYLSNVVSEFGRDGIAHPTRFQVWRLNHSARCPCFPFQKRGRTQVSTLRYTNSSADSVTECRNFSLWEEKARRRGQGACACRRHRVSPRAAALARSVPPRLKRARLHSGCTPAIQVAGAACHGLQAAASQSWTTNRPPTAQKRCPQPLRPPAKGVKATAMRPHASLRPRPPSLSATIQMREAAGACCSDVRTLATRGLASALLPG
jgi:hypothetical protein